MDSKNINSEDNFDQLLLRWMDGDLDGQSLLDFEADPRFLEYKKITDSTSSINIPVVDEKALLDRIKTGIDQAGSKETKIIPLWKKLGSVAAISLVLFAAVMFFNSGVNVDSYHSIQLSHALPDGSQVTLNSDSELSYGNNFEDERILKLEGEAFFEVQKGKTFTVSTNLGDVTVLGTSFNVISRDEVFTVACRTGKVQVEVNGVKSILTPGKRIRYENKKAKGVENIDATRINEWTSGESYFERTPLEDVISSLSLKYDIDIQFPPKYKGKPYTGSFIHYDINKALKMVLVPMGIDYSVVDGNILIK